MTQCDSATTLNHMNYRRSVTQPIVALLANLEPGPVEAFLAESEKRVFQAGQLLQTAGQAGTHLFLVRAGRARYYNTTESGDEIVFRMLTPGDVCGLVTLLKRPLPYMVNVDAISDGVLLAWERRSVRNFAKSHPQISENALQITLRYLKGYVGRHTRLVSATAKRRLAVTLLDLAHRTGSARPHGVDVDTTNEQLGSLSDISRFTTSRLLNEWQRKGTLSKTRGKIIIHAPEGLTTL